MTYSVKPSNDINKRYYFTYIIESKLDRVAFMRPSDGATVVVLQNRLPNSVTKISIRDEEGGRQLNIDLGPKSFTTVVFW